MESIRQEDNRELLLRPASNERAIPPLNFRLVNL